MTPAPMSSTLTRRSVMTGIASIAGLSLLAGCDEEDLAGDPTPSEETTDQPTSEAPASDQPSSEEAPSEEPTSEEPPSEEPASEEPSKNAGGKQKEIKLDVVAKDPHVGDTITIVSAIRHFTAPGLTLLEGDEVVLLQVKVDPSKQFSGIISPREFAIKGANGQPVRGTTAYDKHIEGAGMKALGMPSRRKGPAEGWIAIRLYDKDAAATYEAAYARPKSKVIGKDTVLPEYVKKFTIGA